MKSFFHSVRPLLAVLGALAAALVVTVAVLQVRVWLQTQSTETRSGESLTDQQKLDILASLASTSTPSAAEKSKTLHSLSASATSGPSDEEKLKILESLQAKP